MANETIERTAPLCITGGCITHHLRYSKTPYADMAGAGSTLTAPQIKAIVEKRARIEGDNISGYRYVEEV